MDSKSKPLLIIGLSAKPKNSMDKPEAKSQAESENEIEFPAPQGFTPPEDVKEGGTFEALGTFSLEPNGVLCLKAIDGMPVAHDPAAEEKEEEMESPEDQKAEDAELPPEEGATEAPGSKEDFLSAVMGGLKKKGK
jgi:hypothetical protein